MVQVENRRLVMDYNVSVCGYVLWVISACMGMVGRIDRGRSHVIESTAVGCSPLQSVALLPDRLVVGVATVRSPGGHRLMRNSKCSCHLTVTEVCVSVHALVYAYYVP